MDANHMRIAEEIFRLAVASRLHLEITAESFHASSPSITLTSEKEGQYSGEVIITTHAVQIKASVFLVEKDRHIHASACVTEYLEKLHKRTHKPVAAWAHQWYPADQYPVTQQDN